MLNETKVGKTRKKEVMGSVFATRNGISRISNSLKSRFIVLALQEYNSEQFLEIAKKLLTKRYGMTESLSTCIEEAVWDSGSKDVRDLSKIGKLATNPEDTRWLLNTLRKHSVKQEVQI